MADLQFYPTPPALAKEAADLFKMPITRLLEPEAGRGDLVAPYCSGYRRVEIDCVEIDPDNRAVLKAKGLNVVGIDFMAFDPGPIYSHVIMNPPFNQGAEHVIRAWELLFSGELVAILNAETVRNPYTAARKQLAHLIQDRSATPPKFIDSAFEDPDTKRKARVEIVLIHLLKPAAVNFDFIGKMRKEETSKTMGGEKFERATELMLPGDELSNRIIDFQCAVKAMKVHRHAELRAKYFGGRLGVPLNAEVDELHPVKTQTELELQLIEAMHSDYQRLKDSAWTSVLRCLDVTSRVSSAARQSLESKFEEIRRIEFTLENVQNFIHGLVMQQGEIQIEMLCEVFDVFSRYHFENRCYYKGWKSNDRHRQNAFRLKTTRIILGSCSVSTMKDWKRANRRDVQRFADIDKAFALLDGKRFEDVNGLYRLFQSSHDRVPAGERFETAYFDVKTHYGVGSYHLFPRRADLIDKLNRYVGRHRNWLPHDESVVPGEFWKQYDAAERVMKGFKLIGMSEWDARRLSEKSEPEMSRKMDDCITAAQAKVGIEFFPERLAYSREAERDELMAIEHKESA